MKHTLNEELMARYKALINSRVMIEIPEHSKSEYWKVHAAKVQITLNGDEAIAEGDSGFYAPTKKTAWSRFKKTVTLLGTPSKFFDRFKSLLGLPVNGIRLLDYFLAFEKVMECDPLAQVQLSPSRINFKKLANQHFIYSSVAQCRANYSDCSGGKPFSGHTLVAYYYLNLLNSQTSLMHLENPIILEIGGGNGNLSSVIKWHKKGGTMVSVDLPETLSHSILYLASLFPDARILLPNEITSSSIISDYDFVFLTPKQLNLVNDKYIDLAINVHSFQEMTHDQITDYFEFIQRVAKPESYFFTANRFEKIPAGEGSLDTETKALTNRFSEFPWNAQNEILVHEVCRFFRLVQLDAICNRLEKIK